MFLFWSGFLGLLPVVDVGLEGSDAGLDTSGCSLVTVISSFFGKDDMVAVLGIVVLEDALAADVVHAA